jgi:hypothetical protein
VGPGAFEQDQITSVSRSAEHTSPDPSGVPRRARERAE